MSELLSVWCGNTELFSLENEAIKVPSEGDFLRYRGALYRVEQVFFAYSASLNGSDIGVQVVPFSILNLLNLTSRSRTEIGELMERMGQGDASWLTSAAILKARLEFIRENEPDTYDLLMKSIRPDTGGPYGCGGGE